MSSSEQNVPNHLVLYDVPWDAYTRIIDALGEKRLPHVYQQGTLEMMSPSEDHERIKRFLGRLIESASLELGIKIRSVGSATRQHEELEHGIEPDESYYIGRNAIPAKRSRAKRRPAVPDLVVEVEWSRAVLSKLESYRILGVAEVWRYWRAKVEIFALAPNLQYQSCDRSRLFEQVAAKDLTRLLGRLKKTDENTLVREFIDQLRKSRDH